MNPVLLLSPYDVEDEGEPHPDLVAAQKPTPAQVMQAAGILGLYAGASYLAGEARLSG